MFSKCGLFPVPLARNTKATVVNKVKSKTKFLGKIMAKALMDSRMVLQNSGRGVIKEEYYGIILG